MSDQPLDLSQMPNYEGVHKIPGGRYDGALGQVLDARKVALMVVIEHNGMATAQANIPKEAAADALEQIASMWRAEAEGSTS